MNGDDVRNRLAQKIKFFRTKKALSQAQLAESAHISIPFLSAIERGIKWPYPDTLAKIAAALEVEVSDLFSENEDIREDKGQALEIIKELLTSQQKSFETIYKRFF